MIPPASSDCAPGMGDGEGVTPLALLLAAVAASAASRSLSGIPRLQGGQMKFFRRCASVTVTFTHRA